jgi:hypothetical protein
MAEKAPEVVARQKNMPLGKMTNRRFVAVVALSVALAGPDGARAFEGGAAAGPRPHTGIKSSADVDFQLPLSADGWLDLRALLVASDGSRSLGNHRARFNDSRDRGSKIVFFDPVKGDNETAEVYWWDGKRIVDSAGRAANPGSGKAYGVNPLQPDEDAVRPFRHAVGMLRNADADPRLRTHDRDCEAVAGGYPDWVLFRRGRTHDTFDSGIVGGRSEREPMVVAAYGPLADGRAIIAPALGKSARFKDHERPIHNPMSASTQGANKLWLHMVLSGLDCKAPWSALGSQVADSFSGGPVTAYAEDCRWAHGPGGRLTYLPSKTTIRRSVVAFSWREEAHNQGYFNGGFGCSTTFDEVIFYRNGFKTDPKTDPDPRRDIFSRNIYQGGGAMMGHRYLGIICADGASGMQMRLGGLIEGSLVIEGYWFSGTESNKPVNPWLIASGQSGQSSVVRNNVQLVYAYPTPRDPDTAERRSSGAAQPGWGYTLQSASFGSLVEGNIISQAMLIDELGAAEGALGFGIGVTTKPAAYEDGKTYAQRNNTIRKNIVYRTGAGLQIGGDWSGVKGNIVEGNVFVAKKAVRNTAAAVEASKGLTLQNNRFYCDGDFPAESQTGPGNSATAYRDAAAKEGWPEPNRTLKRYVTGVLGLALLDWQDDPFLDPAARDARAKAGESYDPTGLKTFMAVATNMRRGGVRPVPASGKPSWTGDYAWDERLTGRAVVNWIRAGFGLPAAR